MIASGLALTAGKQAVCEFLAVIGVVALQRLPIKASADGFLF